MQISKEYLQKAKDKQNNVVLWVVVIVVLYIVTYFLSEYNTKNEYDHISRDAEQQTKKIMRDAEAETDRLMRKYRNP